MAAVAAAAAVAITNFACRTAGVLTRRNAQKSERRNRRLNTGETFREHVFQFSRRPRKLDKQRSNQNLGRLLVASVAQLAEQLTLNLKQGFTPFHTMRFHSVKTG
jgi:hypothetical protein